MKHLGYLERSLSRPNQARLVFEGALVGLAGGGIVVLYRMALSGAEKLMRGITGAAAGHPLQILLWFVTLAAVLIIVSKLLLWEPYTQGSGIPQTDAEAIGRIDMPWYRVMAAKFAEGTLCAFAGLSLGREGPSVMLGGMGGKSVSKALHKDRDHESLFVTCGAAAGMAAAFHAPLTGVLFAVEEIHKVFSASLVITAMASAIMSDFLVSQVLGVKPTLNFALVTNLPHVSYPLVAVMGIYCGILGALHNAGMFGCQALYGKIEHWVPYSRLAIPFAISGVIAFTLPDLMCGGDAIIEKLMNPTALTWEAILFLLIGKYLFTTISFASGAPGGTLFPLVVMGSLAGALFCHLANAVGGTSTLYMMNFIYLGIAGLFAAVVRAPVTAIVLVFELTGSLENLLSVSIVAMIAFVTANLLKVDAFYEHLLTKLLGNLDPEISAQEEHGIALRTYHVALGSQAENRTVAELPWPKGTLIVLVERAGERITPHGTTKLEPTDVITAIVPKSSLLEDDRKIQELCGPTIFRRDIEGTSDADGSPQDRS